MPAVRRNVIANYAGQTWAALMSVAFVPFYIRGIGIEAYGIIGFFVALQSLFSILDMGLSATLNRELARRGDVPESADDTRNLVRTLECICWPTGALIALLVWAISGPLAEHWLRTVSMSADRAAHALFLLGLATALQWPVSFYTGGLAGIQRQVRMNVLAAAFATVRGAGAVGVLWLISPTIEAFLWWQVAVSAVQSLVYAAAVWQALPPGTRAPAFDRDQLKQIWRFAIGVTGVTVLSFILTQADRILLSKLFTLDAFGVYAFAASVAVVLLRVVQPICTAVYPRYSQLVAAGDAVVLADFYHRTNQLMAAGLLPIAAVGMLFATDILRLWTLDPVLAQAAGPIMALLLAGTALNGLMNLPYALQLAYGWTSLALRINLVSVCLVVPSVWIAGSEYGGVGAAAVWLALNAGYIVFGIPLMHRRLLTNDMRRWYLHDMLPPLGASLAVALVWRVLVAEVPSGIVGIGLLAIVTITTGTASLAASPYPRRMILEWLATARDRAA